MLRRKSLVACAVGVIALVASACAHRRANRESPCERQEPNGPVTEAFGKTLDAALVVERRGLYVVYVASTGGVPQNGMRVDVENLAKTDGATGVTKAGWATVKFRPGIATVTTGHSGHWFVDTVTFRAGYTDTLRVKVSPASVCQL